MDRPRLFAELEAGTAGSVTLVSAPAGSGKTMLLTSWIQSGRAGDVVAWVSVDRGEADATRFFAGIVDALRKSGAVGDDDPLATLAPAPLGGQDEYVERLIDGLDRLDKPLVMVVDDLHELRSDDALRGLERLLESAPASLRVVLATRRDPKLGLHRLRLDGRLTEIRGEDLEFTTDETGELMSDAGIDLPDEDVERLHGRTEGWAAGLRLAALSLARHDAPSQFVSEFSGSERTVADYLLAEVLAHQDPAARELLLSTCILERVSPDLADELTGIAGSGRLLFELEEANALVSAIDVGRTWFRYHHLLADLLRLELQRERPERICDLHRTAARWLAAHGYMYAAIRHAQEAKDWELATDLLARHWVELVLDGEEATLERLVAAFPADVAEADAEIMAAKAAAVLAQSHWDEVDALLERARVALDAVPPARRGRAEVGVTAVELLRGRRLGGLEDVDIDALLEGAALDLDLQALALMNMGIAETWTLRLDKAKAHLERALDLGRRGGRPHIEVTCLSNLGFIAVITHELTRGEQLMREAIALADRVGWSTQPIIGVAYMGLGQLLADRGRFHEGGEWLARADPILSEASEAAATLALRHAQGMVAIATGRYEDALVAWTDAERTAKLLRTQHFLALPARQWQLRARLGMGELEEVEAGLAERTDGAEWHNLEARLLLERGDPRGAAAAVEPVLADRAPYYHLNMKIEALMLDGVARTGMGEAQAARQSVEAALELAAPAGRMWVISTVPGVLDLLRDHGLHQTAHAAFLTELIDHLSGEQAAAESDGNGALREDLTDRELAVLRFLPTNLSAPEIGSEMFLSVHTVKTHMRRVYAKLDAHSRAEAVQRARAAGLLGPGR